MNGKSYIFNYIFVPDLIVYSSQDAIEMSEMVFRCQTLSQADPLDDFCRNWPHEDYGEQVIHFLIQSQISQDFHVNNKEMRKLVY